MKASFLTFLGIFLFSSLSQASVVRGRCGDHWLAVSFSFDSGNQGEMSVSGDSGEQGDYLVDVP